MTILMYVLACALGLALGWFGYGIAKAAFLAVTRRGGARRLRFAAFRRGSFKCSETYCDAHPGTNHRHLVEIRVR